MPRTPILAGLLAGVVVVVWVAVGQDTPEQSADSKPVPAVGAAGTKQGSLVEEPEGGSLLPDEPESGSLLPDEPEGGSLLPDEPEGGSLLPDEPEGGSLLPNEPEGGSLLPDEPEGGSLLPDEPEGGSLLPDDGLLPRGGGGASDANAIPTTSLEPSYDQNAGGLSLSTETDAAAAHHTYLEWLEAEKRFPTAVTCKKCHPDHFDEWSVSAHAYAQMSPVFNSMHATILKQTQGTNGDFCIRCHTQIGMQREEPLFTSNLKRHPASIEGITCVVCHRVDRNYGKVSGRTAIVEGDLLKEVYGPKGNAILKAAIKDKDQYKMQDQDVDGQRPVHADAKKFDPITTSGFCGSCHDVNLLNGFRLEEAFSQFKNSPANARGENCQDCHMGVIPGFAKPKAERFASARKGGKNESLELAELRKTDERDMNYHWGPAARVGEERTPTPERKRTNHMFAGPDYSIIHPGLFPHSPDLKEFTYKGRISRGERDGKAKPAAIEQAKVYSLADWLSFRWEDGWGTDEFEDRERDNARADIKAAEAGSSKRLSVFANMPKKEQDTLIAAGWHNPNPKKWRSGAGARRKARELLEGQFQLLNRINVERHQVWRRGLQLGEFVVTRNDKRGLQFKVEVVNGTDGHGVPTGFDAERLIILAVTVTDSKGKVVFVSGDRDPNGDVRDLHSAYVHAGKLPIDKYLFNLQSKFLTRNVRGGEQEQILAVNHSPDPLPYIRPDTRAGILVGRPGAARKQAKVLPPAGSRWAKYKVGAKQLTGAAPYRVNVKVVAQMVPVNLIKEIGKYGFDYNLSPREVAKRVVWGHRVSPSKDDSSRRGGALTLWDETLVLDGKWQKRNLKPTEAEIMATPPPPFPVAPPEPEEEEYAPPPTPTSPTPTPEPAEEILPEDLDDLINDGGSLLPDEDGGSLLPEESGESLLPDEDVESLLPDDDVESLLPD